MINQELIFSTINDLSFFQYSPSIWSEEFDKLLIQLTDQKKLISLDQLENTKNFMNSSYLYTHFDNRYNVYVKTDRNLSWVTGKR